MKSIERVSNFRGRGECSTAQNRCQLKSWSGNEVKSKVKEIEEGNNGRGAPRVDFLAWPQRRKQRRRVVM
jgi:hypothetical protein